MAAGLESLFIENALGLILGKQYGFSFSEAVFESVQAALERILHTLSSDFYEKETKRTAIEGNEFAALFPELLPEEEISVAAEKVLSNFKNGMYPVLYGKMKAASDLFVENCNLLADRLNEKKEEIELVLLNGKKFCEISDFVFDSRKSLYGSAATTVAIVTDAGKFFYKPHDCSLDYGFHELNTDFFGRIFKTPKVVKGGYEYGFCEYMTNSVAKTETDARRFYENMGGLSAVLCFTQGQDCHVKNIFADNALPVPIDLEMIVSPYVPLSTARSKKKATFEDYISSIALRGILPHQSTDGTEYSPLLKSIIPVVDGIPKPFFDYKDRFINGFKDTFRYCISIKDELVSWAESLEDAHIRILFGPKQLHAKIADGLNRYNALLSEDLQKKAMDGSFTNLRTTIANECVARECIRIDAMGELPYFYSKMRSRNLFGSFGMEIENYYAQSPLEVLKKNIEKQNEKFLEFNLSIINIALADCLIEEPGFKKDIGERIGVKQRIDEIFLQIKDHFIKTPSGSSLLLGQFNGSPASEPNNMGAEGKTGIALFLKAYSVCFKGTEKAYEASELSDQLLGEVDEYLLKPKDDALLGDCEGLSGMLKCALLINRMEKTPKAKELIDHICRKVESTDFNKVYLSDKYSGLAGMISVYCRFEELENRTTTVSKMADRLLALQTLKHKDLLLWDTIFKRRVISGAAHGMIGIFQALFLACRLTRKEEYGKAAMDAWNFEYGAYDNEFCVWPDFREDKEVKKAMYGFCSGAPGIGSIVLSLQDYKDCIPHYEENLSRAIECCMRQEPLYRDHICCGNGANADFMIDLYNRTGKEEYLNKAESLLVTGKEYAFQSQIFRNTPLLGLYFGSAGVGYELLRLLNPSFFSSALI